VPFSPVGGVNGKITSEGKNQRNAGLGRGGKGFDGGGGRRPRKVVGGMWVERLIGVCNQGGNLFTAGGIQRKREGKMGRKILSENAKPHAPCKRSCCENGTGDGVCSGKLGEVLGGR